MLFRRRWQTNEPAAEGRGVREQGHFQPSGVDGRPAQHRRVRRHGDPQGLPVRRANASLRSHDEI